MEYTYWHKQTAAEPLFPNLLWSRPENKLHAGKLLIIGGNLYGFSAPAEAYQAVLKAGIGTARVMLPECLRKTLGQHLDAAEFGACTPSGSFSRQAFGEFLDAAAWADGVLLAGDLGRNSETAILLESFLAKYSGPVTVTKDAIDYLYENTAVLDRPQTTLVLSLAQLQKLAKAAGSTHAVTFGMDLLQLIQFLHDFTHAHPVNIVVKHLENIFVAVKGQVSTTKLAAEKPVWRVQTASAAAVWWLQHPEQVFEAMTSSLVID
jgi:hypothetical protein